MDKFCSFIVCRLKKNEKLFLKYAFSMIFIMLAFVKIIVYM